MPKIGGPLVEMVQSPVRGVSRLRLGMVLLVLLSAFALLLGADLVSSRRQAIDAAMRDAANLSRVLERHVSATVDKIDVVLSVAAHDFAPYLAQTATIPVERANRTLLRLEHSIPEAQSESLRVINAEGKVVYSSGTSDKIPNVVVADRAYFQKQKDDPNAGLVISEPILSRFTGKWLFVLSRRINAPDGSFAGLVQSAVRADYVESVFGTLNIGPHGNISLFDGEFRLTARHPALPEQLGKPYNLSEIRQAMAEGRNTGIYSVVSRVDGVFRNYTFRQVANLPFFVLIGLSPQDFLQSWWTKAIVYGASFAALTTALVILFLILTRRAEDQSQLAQLVFSNSLEGILITDQRQRIVTANAAFCTMSGYALDELIGQNPMFLAEGLVSPDFQHSFLDELRREGHWRGEVRNRRKSGDILSCWVSISTLRDHAGKLSHFIISFSDISDLKAAEDKLRQLSRAVDQGSDVVLVTDRDGVIQYVNHSFTQLTGYTPDEAIGRTPSILRAEDGVPELYRDLWDTILDGRVWTGEFENRHRDGHHFWVSASISPIRNDAGDITHFLGVESDIGLRKDMEARLVAAKETAENADRTKSEFLATMSHEIRTPMNGIIGMCGLLLDTSLDDQQRHYAHTVRLSAESLLTIINDILDFSRIESGKMEFEEAPFEIRDLIEGVIDILSPRVKGRPVELTYLVEPGADGVFLGDGGRLRQVLLNLVGNAVKFTEHGNVGVEASLRDRDGTPWLRVVVNDTGIGIPAEAQPKLFSMFTQADSSIARRHGGSGLGLAICKRIVEMQGGEIGMSSVEGQGSSFWYSVPLKRSNEAPRQQQSARLPDIRVLVVDDNPINAEVFCRQIQGAGAQAQSAPDVPRGLGLLREAQSLNTPFQVVVLDHHMPGLTGMDMVSVLRTDPAFSGLPIILASSGGAEGLGQAHGFSAVLTKPVHQNVLLETLSDMVAAPRQKASPGTPPSIDPSPQPATRKLRILVAEDNAINQQVAVGLLNNLGHRSDVANDGGEAVSMVEHYDYDLILMDMQMPNVDGIAATGLIRALVGDKSQTPIIAMTANAMSGDRERCLAAGMDDYLSKPIDRRRLAAMLDKWGAIAATRRSPVDAVPPPAPHPSTPMVDQGILDDLLAGLGAKSVISLINLYRSNTQQELGELAEAIQRDDRLQVGKIAHSIKGASLNLGLSGMAEAAHRVEAAAKSAEAPDLSSLLPALQDGLPAVKDLLRQIGGSE